MTQRAPASTTDYRASQQSHHQTILAQLLAHQSGEVAQNTKSMHINTSNLLGLSSASDPYSSASTPSTSMFQSTRDAQRDSTSSSVSTGSSGSYLRTPHVDSFSPLQSDSHVRQNWDNIGWGEMTFGMVAQAQASLSMQMSNANSSFSFEKYPTQWSIPPASIDPGYLHNHAGAYQYPPIPSQLSQAPPVSFAPFPSLATATGPDSPLRSVSPASEEDDASDQESDNEDAIQDSAVASSNSTEAGAMRRSTRIRKRSDSDFILESPGVHKGKSRRLTWTSTSDTRQREFEMEVQKRDLERMREMKRFEESNGKGNRKERRRLQNRLAQRAFRARSKIQGKEVDEHMLDLESLTVDQGERIRQLTQIVDRLQKENTALKAGQWAAFQGGQPHGEEGLKSVKVR